MQSRKNEKRKRRDDKNEPINSKIYDLLIKESEGLIQLILTSL